MTQPIIEIEGVGKRYRIGANRNPYPSLRDEFAKFFSLKARRQRAAGNEFWAVRDVGFSVCEGETVGIIGRNGAGKSTLLKILSQVTPPTEGRITMRGRVASLLEVGTGFHPELTGRENIYLNGAILGMTRGEISRKFDDIVAFAEIDKFLDTPVKRYSSGMYVRLAFAVAAHLDPEILIVDEVLSVGDAEFQKKCLGKMGEVAKGGRTVLFVSHNMTAVSQLCQRGIVLAGGHVDFVGTAAEAVIRYTPRGEVSNAGEVNFRDDDALESQDATAQFRAARLTSSDDAVRKAFFIGESMTLSIDAVFHEPAESAQLSFVVRNTAGLNVYHCVMQDAGLGAMRLHGAVTFTVTFPRLSLYPGSYVIDDLWLANANETLDHVNDVMSFDVAEGGPSVRRQLGRNMAVVHETPEWAVNGDTVGATRFDLAERPRVA